MEAGRGGPRALASRAHLSRDAFPPCQACIERHGMVPSSIDMAGV